MSEGDQPIAVALPGDVLGEASFFSRRERSCTAWAIEPAMLLKIRFDLLSSLAGLSRNLPVIHLNVISPRRDRLQESM